VCRALAYGIIGFNGDNYFPSLLVYALNLWYYERIGYGPADVARHDLPRTLNPRLLNQ